MKDFIFNYEKLQSDRDFNLINIIFFAHAEIKHINNYVLYN